MFMINNIECYFFKFKGNTGIEKTKIQGQKSIWSNYSIKKMTYLLAWIVLS
jgi:hypothetical protein